MRPLFTVRAGEFLAGDYIGRKFRHVDVWVPAKDRGIDLLVTDSGCKKAVSLQVKFSRDFLVSDRLAKFQKQLRACGWWSLRRSKIDASPADYWVFVLAGFAKRPTDFVIIRRLELLKRLDAIHGQGERTDMYLWVTKKGKCWETRGLNTADQWAVARGTFSDRARNFTAFLNNWAPIKKLNKGVSTVKN